MSLYPIFLKLEGHKVLIVGGGPIAEQKIEAVLRSSTDVTVVSPQITPRIRMWAHQGRIKVSWGPGYKAARVSMDDPAVQPVVSAMEQTVGGPVIKMPLLGGSVPDRKSTR